MTFKTSNKFEPRTTPSPICLAYLHCEFKNLDAMISISIMRYIVFGERTYDLMYLTALNTTAVRLVHQSLLSGDRPQTLQQISSDIDVIHDLIPGKALQGSKYAV